MISTVMTITLTSVIVLSPVRNLRFGDSNGTA
jgi:hypothetical protein